MAVSLIPLGKSGESAERANSGVQSLKHFSKYCQGLQWTLSANLSRPSIDAAKNQLPTYGEGC